MVMHFRSIWISDTHLGGKNIQSQQLLDFLNNTESEYLYLVGDMIDLQQLRRKWYWPEINNRIVSSILNKAQNGTRVFYLPGNHDAALRNFSGNIIQQIAIHSEAVHTTLDGRKLLVLHGDKFDRVVQHNPWLAHLGGWIYELLLSLNQKINTVRRFFGKNYFSVSAYLKHKCKKIVSHIGDFETNLIAEMRKHNADGIICGHIHHASIKAMGNFIYSNSGDWVESCTALAESVNGTLGIVEWREINVRQDISAQKINEEDRYSDRCLAPSN